MFPDVTQMVWCGLALSHLLPRPPEALRRAPDASERALREGRRPAVARPPLWEVWATMPGQRLTCSFAVLSRRPRSSRKE
jgi:hypothetical protein